jgi:hypothetical protein
MGGSVAAVLAGFTLIIIQFTPVGIGFNLMKI